MKRLLFVMVTGVCLGIFTQVQAKLVTFDFLQTGPDTGLEIFGGFGFTFLGNLEVSADPSLIESINFSFTGYEDAAGDGPGSGPDFSFSLLSLGPSGGSLDFGTFSGGAGSGSKTLTTVDPGFAGVASDLTVLGGSLFAYEAIVSSGLDLTGVGSFSLSIVVTNQPPVAAAGGPYAVNEGGTADLKGSGQDPDGDALTFAWDLDNDGTFETPGQKVTFSAVGLDGLSSRTVRLRVTDPDGLYSTAEATVSILNVAPTVNASFAASAMNCGMNNGSLNIAFTDPGALDTQTVSVDWGDGSSLETTANATSPNQRQHTYLHAGIYNAKVTVTDNDGGVGQDANNSLAVNFTVEGGGVLPPVNQDGSSVFKYTSTIPVKIKIADCDGSYPSSLAPTIKLTLISGSAPSQTINEPISTSAADTSGIMRFDSTVNQYLYNLATKPLPDPTATYKISITILRTGQVIAVNFGLRT